MSEGKSRLEEKLAKINARLSDEEMAAATGGTGEDAPEPKYSVGTRFYLDGDPEYPGEVLEVLEYIHNQGWWYKVRMQYLPTGEIWEERLWEKGISPV